MKNAIQTLDLMDFNSGDKTTVTRFIDQLKNSFTTTGFFFLKNHLIPESLIQSVNKNFSIFFKDLSDRQRLQYEFPGLKHQVGYTPMKIETGEFSVVPDEKHFFQIGDRFDFSDISEVPQLKKVSLELFDAFRHVSISILRSIAVSLDLPTAYFDLKEGNSVMRAIHYPENENPLVDDGILIEGGNHIGMCAAKHTDINMITLLLAREPGLELWYKNSWLPITITDPNVLIVNCGDMLQHLTNGHYISGLHRVVCEKGRERFSIPYFCHLKEAESLQPLTQFGKPKAKFHFSTAGEFLNFRLQQIGL